MKLSERITNVFFPGTYTDPQSSTNYDATNLQPLGYDGEKTEYELGTPLDWRVNYYRLRLRAFEMYLQSDIVQNAIRKYILWAVGSGLKLDSNPVLKVLESEKIDISEDKLKEYAENVEAQFRLYASMKESTYSKEVNLHDECYEAMKNALLSGDILCLTRFDGENVNIDTIDGGFVQTPMEIPEGKTIVDGVEIDKKGSHVAYWIAQDDFKYKRIPAYGPKTGKRQAWLMYGLKYKKSSTRGLSLLAAVMETATQMDRYKAATLGVAEENANVTMTVEHNQFSDGENIFEKQIAQSYGKGKGVIPEEYEAACNAAATKIAQTSKKTAYNMPIGAKLVRHGSGTDFHFKDYFLINADIIYSTIGIPPEVAHDKFGGAYSGSRAAIKSWEYKLNVDRDIILTRQFYYPFFIYWLDVKILQNKIQAPGYIGGNTMVKAAYRKSRFIGPTVPHIDPVKEANAERIILGKSFENVPLGTAEQACENLNRGDYDQVIKKTTREYEDAETFTSIGADANADNGNEPAQSSGVGSK